MLWWKDKLWHCVFWKMFATFSSTPHICIPTCLTLLQLNPWFLVTVTGIWIGYLLWWEWNIVTSEPPLPLGYGISLQHKPQGKSQQSYSGPFWKELILLPYLSYAIMHCWEQSVVSVKSSQTAEWGQS